jgi:hypothetical protein
MAARPTPRGWLPWTGRLTPTGKSEDPAPLPMPASPRNPSDPLPPRRVVLLGASNVCRGLSTALETACSAWGGPLDVLAAFGHGRSYGVRSSMLWRELPGIAECGLWEALARRPAAPTAALVTDVGNDLLLDVPAPQIAAWVEECVERLLDAGARVVLTPLPLCNVERLSPGKFLLFRSVLYPGCRLGLATVVARARDLDARLRQLAARRGLALVEHRAEWYGFDPVHIRRGRLAGAWHAMLSRWREVPSEAARGSLRRWLYLWHVAAERRWLFGREFRRAQPAGVLPDGTTLALY